jgi:hypothetical protein
MARNWIIVIAGALALVAVGALSVLLLGGGDDDGGSGADPDATATLTPGDFGPPPTLGDWVLEVFPIHASIIPQSGTRTPNPNNPSGVCIEASFHDLPQNGLWFRMVVDGAEVTDSPGAVWIVTTEVNPEGGTFCYAPTEGFEVGVHEAAVSVQDPNNPQAAIRQLVGWKFEVVPD